MGMLGFGFKLVVGYNVCLFCLIVLGTSLVIDVVYLMVGCYISGVIVGY